jgi:hypothetical protein
VQVSTRTETTNKEDRLNWSKLFDPYICDWLTDLRLWSSLLNFINLLFDQRRDLVTNVIEYSLQHAPSLSELLSYNSDESAYGLSVIVSSITPTLGLSSTPLSSTEKFLLLPVKLRFTPSSNSRSICFLHFSLMPLYCASPTIVLIYFSKAPSRKTEPHSPPTRF